MPRNLPPSPPVRRLVKEPVYFQLCDLLRDLVRAGGYAAGVQFLTEREVAERFGISRVTANKALSHLVIEGTLEFRKGVGTFVRTGGLDYDLQSLVSFTQKASLAGKTPATRVLRMAKVAADGVGDRVRQELCVGGSEELFFIERLRLADDIPMILERRFIPVRFCPELDRHQLSGSLYTVLTKKYGIQIAGADQTIRAISLDTNDASLLTVKRGASALWVHGVGFQDGPIWVEDTLYRGDLYEFRNRIGVAGAVKPARVTLCDASTGTRITGPDRK